jgi:hypothetical protein
MALCFGDKKIPQNLMTYYMKAPDTDDARLAARLAFSPKTSVSLLVFFTGIG